MNLCVRIALGIRIVSKHRYTLLTIYFIMKVFGSVKHIGLWFNCVQVEVMIRLSVIL